MQRQILVWEIAGRFWVYCAGFMPFKTEKGRKAWMVFDNAEDAIGQARMIRAYHDI